MKRIIDYWCDEIPTDIDIRRAISIATVENVIVRINWFVKYNGNHAVMISEDDTVDIVVSKIPKRYGV